MSGSFGLFVVNIKLSIVQCGLEMRIKGGLGWLDVFYIDMNVCCAVL